MVEISTESYHGWIIRLFQSQTGYSFQCWRPRQQTGITGIIDVECFPTPEQTRQAAQLRADLESTRLALNDFLRGKFQFLLLRTEEQTALEQSIVQYIDAAKHQVG